MTYKYPAPKVFDASEFGAFGTDDDTAAINAAITYAANNGGGTVLLGRSHTVSGTISVPELVSLQGRGGHSNSRGTTITSSALSGPVIQMIGRSTGVRQLRILSTTERRAATTTTGHGIFIANSDVVSGYSSFSRIQIYDVDIRDQPTDGLHTIGTLEHGLIELVTVTDGVRHGFVFSGGAIAGYVNVTGKVPFMAQVIRCRAFECGGQALIALSDVNGPQGLELNNFEALGCAWNAAKRNGVNGQELFQVQLGGRGHIVDRIDVEDQQYANTTTATGGKTRTALSVPAKGVYCSATGVVAVAPFFSSLRQSWFQDTNGGLELHWPTVNPGTYATLQNPAIEIGPNVLGVDIKYRTTMTTGATVVLKNQSIDARIEKDGIPQVGLALSTGDWSVGTTPVPTAITSGTLTTLNQRVRIDGEGGAADSVTVIRIAGGVNGFQGLDLWLYRGNEDIQIRHFGATGNIKNTSNDHVMMTATQNTVLHYIYDGQYWVQDGVAPEAVNVKDYGAKGDWNTTTQTGTDDSAAFAAAYAVAANVKKLYIPSGNYRLTSTLVIDKINSHVEGEKTATLYVDHTNGPGIRLSHRESTLRSLTVRCSDARSAASFDTTNIGIRVEGPNTSTFSLTRTKLEDLTVIGHPSHGVVMAGAGYHTIFERILSQSNKGHGFVIDGGEITGRTTAYRDSPGISSFRHLWAVFNGGHGLVLGSPNATTVPFRILFDNVECADNATDEAVRFTPDEVWVFGDSCEYYRSAFGPTAYSTTVGDGSTSVFTITHNLNSQNVGITVTVKATGALVSTFTKSAITDNTVTLTFASPPASGSLNVAVHDLNRQGIRVSGRNWTLQNNRSINLGRAITLAGTVLANLSAGGSRVEIIQAIPAHLVGVVIESGVLAACRVILPSTTNMPVPVQDNAAVTLGNVIITQPPQNTPAALSATNNDYNWLLGNQTLRLTAASGGSTITGLAWPSAGRQVRLVNVGTDAITLAHQSTGSTANNRILTSTGSNYSLAANSSVLLEYDGTTARWRVL